MSSNREDSSTKPKRERNPIAVLNLSSSIFNVQRLSFSPYPEVVPNFLNFEPYPRDVVLASYVKCDNKIIEIILWKLLRPNMNLPDIDVTTNRYLRTYETVGLREASQPAGVKPRLVKTHLPYQMVPHNPTTKYIYVVRKPWDVIPSCYKAVKKFTDYGGSFEDFVYRFTDGRLGYGDYFGHVASWYKHKYLPDNDFLLLSYELVKAEPRSALFSIAAFLGDHYLEHFLQRDDLMLDVLRTIDQCRQKDCPTSGTSKSGTTSNRSSKKYSISSNQSRMLVDCIEDHLKNTGVEDLWKGMLKASTTLNARREELNTRNQRLSSYI